MCNPKFQSTSHRASQIAVRRIEIIKWPSLTKPLLFRTKELENISDVMRPTDTKFKNKVIWNKHEVVV